MFRQLVGIALVLAPFTPGWSQSEKEFYHPNSYLLELPEAWKKPKTIKAITAILPATIEELKDKDFFTSGKADYIVKVFVDSLRVFNRESSSPLLQNNSEALRYNSNLSFSYSFLAGLRVYDSLERPIAFLKLVPLEEVFEYSKTNSYHPTNAGTQYVVEYDSAGRRLPADRLLQSAAPIVNDPPSSASRRPATAEEIEKANLTNYGVLSPNFLLQIVERRIYKTRDLLKQLEKRKPH